MRIAARLGGVLLLVASMAACDKAQVAVLESQTLALTLSASSTLVELYNVWDLIEDNDGNQQPDDGVVYLFCERIPNAGGPPVTIGVGSAPWPHSLRISILRADSTAFEPITDAMFLDPEANLTLYDDRVLFNNLVTKVPVTIDDMGMMRRFIFLNPRQLTAVNRDVVTSRTNPLFELAAGTFGYREGLCSLGDPGDSSIAGAPQPFMIELGKGETVKVEARKNLDGAPGLVDETGASLLSSEPGLVGRMSIDGINIVNLSGTTSSSTSPADGISFTYTSR